MHSNMPSIHGAYAKHVKRLYRKSLVTVLDGLSKAIQIQICPENVSGCDFTQTY